MSGSGLFYAAITCLLASLDLVLVESKTDYTCETFPDYGAYKAQWQADAPTQIYQKMYPFGEVYCDTTTDAEGARAVGFDPRIDFEILYYGKTYKSLWVSPCGFIALDEASSATLVPFRWIDQWPNSQYPLLGATDPPFIAPFYSEADLISKTPEPGMLLYRVLNPGTAPSGGQRSVMEGMLEDISLNIQEAVLGAEKFMASYGIIVTWYRVTFAVNDCNPTTNSCARNTYQTVIVTDGQKTFTVFNYYNMTWVGGGGDQHCDRKTGTPTGAPSCKPGHIGFNAGDGREFHALPYSGKESIRNIDDEGGSDVNGRFYYQVSGNSVFRGGCTSDTSFAGSSWPTEIFPKSGGMLGGTEVNISGPCFPNPDRIKCRFDNMVLDAVYVDNVMRVTCVAPLMYKVGPIKIGVSIDGGSNFKFETDYIVVTPDHVLPGVAISRQHQDWLNPVQMELAWSPPSLTPFTTDRVNIKLFGYREDSSSGTPKGVWQELVMIAEDYSNSGRFLLITDNHMCDYNAEGQLCTSYDVGAFQISVEYPTNDPTNPRRIWSLVFPLGWYIQDALNQAADGSNWILDKCKEWSSEDDDDVSWIDNLDPCPCTFQQAYTDFGRFQPDALCRQGSTAPANCERHQGAMQCFLSTKAVSSTGAGNQCCYDTAGELMYSGDDEDGSRPQRSHDWGAPPYQSPPRIPKMSHWVNDITGFYYCCAWQSTDYECHKSYLSLRHTRSCERYMSPGQAIAFGDPHFMTFDGVFYTFNGYGEFWLMQVKQAPVHGEKIDFKLHGRFEQPANQSWGQTKATYMTAVGMQINESHLVVLELNQGGAQKKILVHFNDYLLDLTERDLRRQEFNDVIIINNDEEGNIQATNFTVLYRCGIGINVVWRDNLLDAVVSAPPEFKHYTKGLFGNWDDEQNNDLEPNPPGGPAFEPEETEKVHNLFGVTWRVTSSESCFRYIYRSQLNHNYYNRDNFVPNYIPTFPPNNTKYTDGDVQAVCNNEPACTFDFKTALSEQLGRNTLQMKQWDAHRRSMGQTVLYCEWLDVPYSIKSIPYSYEAGNTVTLTGCVDGYGLDGPTQYTCQSNGDGTAQWQPDVTSVCRGPDAPIETAKVIAIAVPCALAFVLIIIGIVVLILVVRKKKKQKRLANESKQVYVPVFQEIIDWRARTDQPSTSVEENAEINSSKKTRARAQSKEGMADFMGGGADAFGGPGPQPIGKKPPRPDLNRSRESLDNIVDLKPAYENKTMDDSSQTVTTSSGGQHVSWDTTDGDKVSDKPVKQSTLKSQKNNKKNKKDKSNKETVPPPAEVSPIPSPKPAKKKRPYQYPSESRDNSVEDWRSNESPMLKIRHDVTDEGPMYRPRDTHAYTTGHSIPTSDNQASNYYKRKYGRYNNTSFS